MVPIATEDTCIDWKNVVQWTAMTIPVMTISP